MKRWLLACLSMLCMVALLAGCGNDTAKDSKQGKHMNVGLYWFGETLDPGSGRAPRARRRAEPRAPSCRR